MPKITTLSQNIFSERSEQAINAQPLRREVFLAELELLDEDKIGYKGSALAMSSSAFSDLLKVLKIPKAFIKRFGDMMQDRPEAKKNFINTIKNVMSNKGSGSKTVTLVLSRESKKIVAVHSKSRNLISNNGMLDVVNQVIEKNGLDVVDFSVGKDGEVAINTIDTKNQFDIQGMKDEVFSGGISFVNNPKNGFIVSPYLNRLFCANGCVTRGFEEQFKLTSTDGDGMQKFFSDLANLAKGGYKPDQFVARVEDATRLKASLNEMYSVKQAVKRFCPSITKEELESWVPLLYTENAYKRIGIEPHLLNTAQKKNARTDTSLWDLINGLTHFATHNNGYNEISDYDRHELQIHAGRMLTSNHDLENFVRNPFSGIYTGKDESVQAENAY